MVYFLIVCNGNGKNPGENEVLEVAKTIGLDLKKARIISKEIQECVKSRLSEYI